MSKVFFLNNGKECIKSYNRFQIFCTTKNAPFYEIHVHWVNLMKNQIIQKFQSLEILKEMFVRQRIHFFNHLAKKLCSMGSKCLALGVGHMWRK